MERVDDYLMTCPEAAAFLYAENVSKTRERVIRLVNSGKLSGRKEGEGQKSMYFIRHSSARAYRDGDTD
jgi:hypothetical protein